MGTRDHGRSLLLRKPDKAFQTFRIDVAISFVFEYWMLVLGMINITICIAVFLFLFFLCPCCRSSLSPHCPERMDGEKELGKKQKERNVVRHSLSVKNVNLEIFFQYSFGKINIMFLL